MGHKEQGKIHFQNEEYEQALTSYRAALNPEYACPSVERQVLLSVRGSSCIRCSVSTTTGILTSFCKPFSIFVEHRGVSTQDWGTGHGSGCR